MAKFTSTFLTVARAGDYTLYFVILAIPGPGALTHYLVMVPGMAVMVVTPRRITRVVKHCPQITAEQIRGYDETSAAISCKATPCPVVGPEGLLITGNISTLYEDQPEL